MRGTVVGALTVETLVSTIVGGHLSLVSGSARRSVCAVRPVTLAADSTALCGSWRDVLPRQRADTDSSDSAQQYVSTRADVGELSTLRRTERRSMRTSLEQKRRESLGNPTAHCCLAAHHLRIISDLRPSPSVSVHPRVMPPRARSSKPALSSGDVAAAHAEVATRTRTRKAKAAPVSVQSSARLGLLSGLIEVNTANSRASAADARDFLRADRFLILSLCLLPRLTRARW